jgi:hypothetical protein
MEFHIRKAMKHILVLTVLLALMLAPPALFAQAKPEVANTSTAAKRAIESAPARTEGAMPAATRGFNAPPRQSRASCANAVKSNFYQSHIQPRVREDASA